MDLLAWSDCRRETRLNWNEPLTKTKMSSPFLFLFPFFSLVVLGNWVSYLRKAWAKLYLSWPHQLVPVSDFFLRLIMSRCVLSLLFLRIFAHHVLFLLLSPFLPQPYRELLKLLICIDQICSISPLLCLSFSCFGDWSMFWKEEGEQKHEGNRN